MKDTSFSFGFIIAIAIITISLVIPIGVIEHAKANNARIFESKDYTNTLTKEELKSINGAVGDYCVGFFIYDELPKDIDYSNKGIKVYCGVDSKEVKVVGQDSDTEAVKLGKEMEKEISKDGIYNTLMKYESQFVSVERKAVDSRTHDTDVIPLPIPVSF